ncbi:O-methyltransferase [Neolentinus lepideus HHB14362 ss-1]|uniref:O-methyltransferase n=1 Tax=Neolentinus lepideus HHB14362 ss-1 TaxID=1314782 RepID=A0A165PEG0_9AGAM|nr:O-methyltransferase [Neolentinus lepideus HHB14362 ss-1]
MTIKTLKALRSIIDDSIDKLEAFYAAKNLDFPDLDEPYSTSPSEAALGDPEIVETVNAVVGASYQLIASVRTPFIHVIDTIFAYTLSSCVRVAEESNTPEILREAGPAGLHVNDIAAKNGLEPTKLARVLRVLASHHIFREVKPNVFATNRVSSYIDTGKPSEYLFSPDADKHSGTSGVAGFIDHVTDEVMKANAHLWETMSSPEKGHSFDALHAPLQEWSKTDQQFFWWIELPGNEKRLLRYSAAMRATSLWNSPDAILHGFDWASLTPNDVLVDVGGGTGMPSMYIARAFPDVRIVIQERDQVCEHGIAYWKGAFPEAINSGRVQFQAHEFFQPQPTLPTNTPASVYLLRTVLHDWPDHECVRILKNLRAAATPKTKLLIGDFMIPYACPDDSVAARTIPGAKTSAAPAPLLANFGKGSATSYALDMAMFTNFNAQERTLAQLAELCQQTGWKPIQAHRRDDTPFGFLVSEPIPV